MHVPPLSEEIRPRRRYGPRVLLGIVVAVLFVLFASAKALAGFYTDKLWFDDLGFGKVFSTLIWARIAPAVIFSFVMFVVLLVNLVLAGRLAPEYRTAGVEDEVIDRYVGYVTPYMGRVRVLVSLAIGALVGFGASSQWREWIMYQNRVTWGIKDAQFHKDIGFYVFELPFLKFIAEWSFVVFFVSLFITAVFHYINGGIRVQAGFQRVTPQVKAHLSVLLAAMAITKTAQYWLGRYDLVYSHRGKVDGATFTDIHAQLPALEFLALISVVGAILFVVNIWRRGWTLPIIAAGLWAFISIIVGTAYPAWMQRFQVQPAEQSKEQPYIERNIAATRAAYGLDKFGVQIYKGNGKLDAQAVKESSAAKTLSNVRLWDPDALQTAIAKQNVKGYYQLGVPSIDRYTVGAVNKQLAMVSVRGLNSAELPSDTWTNRHLAYTHGQAAVVVQANATSVSASQDPSYLVSGIPAAGETDIKISQPDVYYAPSMSDYVIGATKEKEVEVDGSGNEARDQYRDTKRGISLSSLLRKAAFATRFSDFNLLISDRLQSQSKMLFVRDPAERVRKAAPFLSTDSEAYPVVLPDGTMQWVVDAYTSTDKYPYSQEIRPGDVSGQQIAGNYNYARNSVKAVVDAYNGSVSLYIVDPTDPLIRAYSKAFPSLFQPASAMPNGLAEHLRAPTDLFKAQMRMLEQYHVLPTQAGAFYGGTQRWRIAPQPSVGTSGTADTTPTTSASAGNDGGRNGQNQNDSQRVEPQYQMLQLPDGTQQEFVLTTSFVPASKNDTSPNILSAFVAARNDGFGTSNFGRTTVFDSSSGSGLSSEVFAAAQIQKDTLISQRISLLGQGGSSITPGAVQLLPIGDSILYAQPFFINSDNKGAVPGLAFVALDDGKRAVFANSVAEALKLLYGDTVAPPDNGNGGPPATITDAERLKKIKAALDEYQSKTKSGEFEAAGKALRTLGDLVNGVTTPTSTTPTTPTPGTATTTNPRSNGSGSGTPTPGSAGGSPPTTMSPTPSGSTTTTIPGT